MSTVAELGRKFKAKHAGAYDDLSDIEVGQKVKAKYPGAYDDFVDSAAAPEEPGVLSRFVSSAIAAVNPIPAINLIPAVGDQKTAAKI